MDLSSLCSKLLPGFTTLGFKDERRNKGESSEHGGVWPQWLLHGCPDSPVVRPVSRSDLKSSSDENSWDRLLLGHLLFVGGWISAPCFVEFSGWATTGHIGGCWDL